MKPIIFNADIVDPVDGARRDYMELVSANAIAYRGNLKRKTELKFQVKWLGYDETHNSREPYANLRDSDQLHVFLSQNNLHMAPANCEFHHSQATLLETQAQFCVSNFLDMKLHFQ